MSDFTNRVSSAIKKQKDTAQIMNRINYYKNQIARLNSQQGDFPFERRPGLGKEMTAMYQALWKEYQNMGWGIDKFEKDVSNLIGKNFHVGAIAKHAEEYDLAIKAVDDALEHSAMQYYYASIEEVNNVIEHHGIKGMKWGIRRYQNPDGSLTELGKKHYGEGTDHRTEKVIENFRQQKSIALAKGNVDFAREFMDYLSNAEISAFKERISARTRLDDLKQEARKVTEEKLRSWSNMAQSASQFLSSGISTYNNLANVINAVTKKKTLAPISNNGPGKKGKGGGGDGGNNA